MSTSVNLILQDCRNGLLKMFDHKLKRVLLYGSYARGDFNSESDIDIMVLVEMSEQDIKSIRAEITDLGAEISYNNDILVSMIAKDMNQFNSWLPIHPFYKNVIREGVEVFG